VSGVQVVLAGGGTAGHIEPALAVADALRVSDPSVGITALGTARGLETTLVPERGYDLALIPAVPLPRRPSVELLRVPGRLRQAVDDVCAILDRTGADVVVGFGGYVAGPAYLAARRRRVPMVVHEANARPGLANRLGARFTPWVAVAVPGSLPRARYVGMPLRPAIARLDRAARRTEAREAFGLEPDRPTLLISGGSQGSRRLNEAGVGAAAALAASGIQVLHASGPSHDLRVARGDGEAPYVVVPYIERMDLAYSAADLMLCRAGAMTCAELAATGLPAIYVPLPIGNGEQRLNARPVVDAGGGLIVDDSECTPAMVEGTLATLILDQARLATMSTAASRFGRRDADRVLADLVIEAAASRKESP
jgi:UDP-N-acetylglucosamine--N-acetylmuramyl-(pentapeptide) pyrophosphoryl-undecaprenol N-acetylglucosamine transferase